MSQFAMSLSPAESLSLTAAGEPVPARVPEREEWVEAASKLLAYGCTVEQLNSKSLAEIVGVPESRLLEDFPEKNDFLTAVLKRLLDEIAQARLAATRTEEPSLFRICRGIWASLNAHLRRPAIPELLRVLQNYRPAQSFEQLHTAAQLSALQAELEAAGVAQAASYARIVNAMTMDIVDAEHSSGQTLAERRRSICGYLRRLSASAPDAV